MIIQHNITALHAYNNWSLHNNRMSKALGRLSSGYRINSAADDPAGLAVSERMKAQLTQLKREKLNTMDAMSSIQIHEGIQSGVSDMLLRMQELATASMSDTLQDSDRAKLNEEYQQMIKEIDRSNSAMKNNSISLFRKESTAGPDQEKTILQGNNINAYLDALDGFLQEISIAARDGDTEKLTELGVDANASSDQEKVRKAVMEFTMAKGQELLNTPVTEGVAQRVSIELSGGDIKVNLLYSSTEELGLRETDISSASSAKAALEAVKNASSIVTRQRSQLGAVTNRLEHTINVMSTMEENLEDSLSRITDADMAKEMMEFVRSQVLCQASMFVMSVASHQPEQILQLLKTV